MTHQIKGFVTCDSFINNETDVVSSLYEISNIGLTYARRKQQYYSTTDSLYSLYVFKNTNPGVLSASTADGIISVVKEFVLHCTVSQQVSKQQMLISFLSNYNQLNPSNLVSDLSVGKYINSGSVVGVDYMYFTVNGIICTIWLNDPAFQGFFPDYEVNIIDPIPNFSSVVGNGALMFDGLAGFNITEFNNRIEENKDGDPTTVVRVINVPYRLPNSTLTKDCNFAFSQYGNQGNHDYVLKVKLYEHLLAMGLTAAYIEFSFPTILQVNEFFIVPRWERFAIPTYVGEKGIMSQISSAYTETFDLEKFIKLYSDVNYLKANTYNVPYDYNNILLSVTNGFYTDPAIKDFKTIYSDMITISSSHQDFGRMRLNTQRFLTMLENMLFICDSDNSSSLFAKLMANDEYTFKMASRQGVWYLSCFYGPHCYYMLPKYQFTELNV